MLRPALLMAAAMYCVSAQCAEAARETSPDPKDYQRFATESVESIQFASLYGWEPIDDDHLVLYTGVRRAWMLDLAGGCMDLDFAFKINVTSSGQRIYAKFDKIQTRNRTCRIMQIRKIDMDAFDAARRQLQGGNLELGNAEELFAADPVDREKEAQ